MGCGRKRLSEKLANKLSNDALTAENSSIQDQNIRILTPTAPTTDVGHLTVIQIADQNSSIGFFAIFQTI